MTEKGLVVRDVSKRSHVYAPSETQDQTQRTMVDYLLSKAFGGSAMKLVMQALSASQTSKEDLAMIRKMIDKAERAKK
jgi:predicted transcriptional regulator